MRGGRKGGEEDLDGGGDVVGLDAEGSDLRGRIGGSESEDEGDDAVVETIVEDGAVRWKAKMRRGRGGSEACQIGSREEGGQAHNQKP